MKTTMIRLVSVAMLSVPMMMGWSSSVAQASVETTAKSWIATRESGGNYAASNGLYYGRYQLAKTLLHGDYSKANQERVANQYVAQRYGSWAKAKQHWLNYGWY